MDDHLPNALVRIDYKGFAHLLGRINSDCKLGLHTGNRQHFVNIQKHARELFRLVDTENKEKPFEEVIGKCQASQTG